MKNYLLPIYHSKLKPWIKWWLLKQLELRSKTLSDWIEGTTPITITGAFKEKIQNLELEGNTSQTGTPTPDNPIPVQVVKGDNYININSNSYRVDFGGDNKLPQDKYIESRTTNGITYTNNGDGTFSLSGTASANTSIQIIPYNDIDIQNGKSYYLWSNVPYNSNTFNMSIRFKEDTTQRYLIANGTVTVSNTATISNVDLVFWINSGNTVNAQNVKLMLVEGNTAPSRYSPYVSNPIELCKIGNYKDSIKKSGGKNLCDIVLDSSVTGNIEYKTYTLKPNTQYIVSSNTWVSSTSTANVFVSSGTSFSPSSATNGVNGSRVVISDNNGNITIGYRNVNNSMDYASGQYFIMLNEGPTALPYEPYGNNWYIEKNIGKVVLNGTQNITLAGSGVRRFNATYSTLGISNVKEGINATDTAQYRKNDHFVYSGTVTTWGNYYMYSNCLVLFDTGSIIADVNALNTWFTNNPTSIYYALATTTTETITNTNLISQLDAIYNAEFKNGTNTITQTNLSLPFILHFKYYKKG